MKIKMTVTLVTFLVLAGCGANEGNAPEGMESAAGDAADAVSATMGDTLESAGDAVDAIQDAAENVADQAGNMANDAMDAASDAIESGELEEAGAELESALDDVKLPGS